MIKGLGNTPQITSIQKQQTVKQTKATEPVKKTASKSTSFVKSIQSGLAKINLKSIGNLFKSVLAKKTPSQMQKNHQALDISLPTHPSRPDMLANTAPGKPLCELDDKQLTKTLMKAEGPHGPRFKSSLRTANDIKQSGVLDDMKLLVQRDMAETESELFRSVEDDAVLVMSDLSQLSPEKIETLKNKAYEHPEVNETYDEAIKMGHFGSDRHKQYGALVEALTGGIISAEEAMAMNPTGGIPGPGDNEVPLVGRFDNMARHAMRHDATGFLLTRFDIGPGYSTQTTMLGMDESNPLSGQWLGVIRETVDGSDMPDFSHVGKPSRFA